MSLFNPPISKIYYDVKCPICKVVGLQKLITKKNKNKEDDFCFWCVNCEDQIADSAAIHLERKKK